MPEMYGAEALNMRSMKNIVVSMNEHQADIVRAVIELALADERRDFTNRGRRLLTSVLKSLMTELKLKASEARRS